MPGGRPMTVVFSAMSSATPRTMKEMPRVTMKAGTLSLAMMTPLQEPDDAGGGDRGGEADDGGGEERHAVR